MIGFYDDYTLKNPIFKDCTLSFCMILKSCHITTFAGFYHYHRMQLVRDRDLHSL